MRDLIEEYALKLIWLMLVVLFFWSAAEAFVGR